MSILPLYLSLVLLLGVNAKSPHIFFILIDDPGFNDFSFHGSNQIPTPNIDALAYRGVILDKYYTQQTCTPSRAALLTGNYPIRSGMQGIPMKTGEERHIPLDMPTLPERLKQLGYKTHLVGKWHLGYAHESYTPTGRGFDTFFGYYNGFCGYWNYKIPSEYSSLLGMFTNELYHDLHTQNTPEYDYTGRYATDVFTEKAIEIIDSHNSEEPMFMMVSHLGVHAGYDGVELGVPNITSTKEKYHYIGSERRQRCAEIINLVDNSIGVITARLNALGMLNDSLIFISSDNGAQTTGVYANSASNWPFRGLKFTLFEGGVRGSAVLWSASLQKKGYVNRELMHISDILPTLYQAAGGNVADLGNIDGISQWDVISKNVKTNRSEILLNIDEKEKTSGIIGQNGKYKLLAGSFKFGIYDDQMGETGRGTEVPPYNMAEVINSPVNRAIEQNTGTPLAEDHILETRELIDRARFRTKTTTMLPQKYYLFDLDEDPCENDNRINDGALAGVVEELKAKLATYTAQLVPQQNKEPDPNSRPTSCNNTWYSWMDPDGCHITKAELQSTSIFHWFTNKLKLAMDITMDNVHNLL